MMQRTCLSPFLLSCALLSACGETYTDGDDTEAIACDAEPVIRMTDDGVPFVRTPDSCFDALPDWSYEARYVELDGLRQAYVDEGPADGPVVLLLHGQPSWSYLYRKMIPVLSEAGYRVIAMDHLGMGRSDKPTEIDAYTYLGHADRLTRFIEALELRGIRLFVQDWGSLIGLRVAGLNPEWFSHIAVGNGMLPVIPAGLEPHPAVDNPDEIVDIPSVFANYPAQQVPFYDGCEPLVEDDFSFGAWMEYAMKGESFHAAEVLEALTWFDLPDAEEAAYDAPFPSRDYMAGARTFPSLINDLPGNNADAWAGLASFERPFLTLWADNDPGSLGACQTQQILIDTVPGAAGPPHDRLPEASHFLQDDQGAEISRRLALFFAGAPMGRGARYCEVLLAYQGPDGIEAEVWGTPGLNYCPSEAWGALDPQAIATDYDALTVIMNGPRRLVMSSLLGTLADDERRMFGDIEMRKLATVQVDPNQASSAYTETTVLRDTTYTFDRGSEIYELTSDTGQRYVMQSMSMTVDPELELDDLSMLGERLMLPEGWIFEARILDEDLVLVAGGMAVVLQDELQNTYQGI